MANEYDVVVLGGGTGGYVAAIRAAMNGRSVAIVEKEKLGGTCLHKGCIPSKSLLRSADVFTTVKKASEYGVALTNATLDFSRVQERKAAVVAKLYEGVQQLVAKRKIDVYEGKGRILGPSIFSPTCGTISIEHQNGEENTMLIPQNVIIATGSSPATVDGIDIDGEFVLTSDEALELTELPKSIIIVGAGVIGIEWASLLNDFGVEVTVIEAGERILPTEDFAIATEAKKQFMKKGIRILTGATLNPSTFIKGEHSLKIEVKSEDKQIELEADKMLIAVGRKPNIKDIGLDNTNIKIENNAICVNEMMQTEESHIYAIGDVVGGMQLAHVASREGIIAADHLTGIDVTGLREEFVPKCTYSKPEIASVGLTEAEAKATVKEIKTATFPFKANGKALIYGEGDGFIKFVVDAHTDDLLGVHIIGDLATEMISEAALAKFVDAANIEIAEMIHPHPTLSEVYGEVAYAIEGKAIHF